MKYDQADRFILNLDDSPVSTKAFGDKLRRDPIRGLKEIKIVQGGKVTDFYPWVEEQ